MSRPPEIVEIAEPTGSRIIGKTVDNDLENVESSDPTSTMILIEGKTDDKHSENMESSVPTSTMVEEKPDDMHSENMESSVPTSTRILIELEGKTDDRHSETMESSFPTSTRILIELEGKTDDKHSETMESSVPTSTVVEEKPNDMHSETMESSVPTSTRILIEGNPDDKHSGNLEISDPVNSSFDGETDVSGFKDVDDHCQSGEVINRSSDRPNTVDYSHSELANSPETTNEQLQEKISKQSQKEDSTDSVSIARKACSQEEDRKSGGEISVPNADEELTARVRRIEERFAILEEKIGNEETFPLMDDKPIRYLSI